MSKKLKQFEHLVDCYLETRTDLGGMMRFTERNRLVAAVKAAHEAGGSVTLIESGRKTRLIIKTGN